MKFVRVLILGGDKRNDADLFVRYALLLGEALDQGGYKVVKTCLKSAIVAEINEAFGNDTPHADSVAFLLDRRRRTVVSPGSACLQ